MNIIFRFFAAFFVTLLIGGCEDAISVPDEETEVVGRPAAPTLSPTTSGETLSSDGEVSVTLPPPTSVDGAQINFDRGGGSLPLPDHQVHTGLLEVGELVWEGDLPYEGGRPGSRAGRELRSRDGRMVVMGNYEVREYRASRGYPMLTTLLGSYSGVEVDAIGRVLLEDTSMSDYTPPVWLSGAVVSTEPGSLLVEQTLVQDDPSVDGSEIEVLPLRDGRLVVASPLAGAEDVGAVYIVDPAATSVSDGLIQTIVGDNPDSYFGQTMAEVEDHIVVCAPWGADGDRIGQCSLIATASGEVETEFRSDSTYRLGGHVANIGDIDGDGSQDFAVGVPEYGGDYAGSVFIYTDLNRSLRPTEWIEDTFRIRAPGPEMGFGAGIYPVGDVNTDGLDDFVVAAPLAGEAYLYFGRDAKLLAGVVHDHSVQISGDEAGFPTSVARVDATLFFGNYHSHEQRGAVYAVPVRSLLP
jgi:hypothetical protein